VKITVVSHDGTARTFEVAPGTTLMEAAKAHDVPGIDAVCGGNCYCGTCRVHVAQDWLPKLRPADSFEVELITAAGDSEPNARLSCQIALVDELDGLVVHTPEQQVEY
jgi:ferredoxin, 2Fe-2S